MQLGMLSFNAKEKTQIRPGQARFVCEWAIQLEFFVEFKHVDTGTFLGTPQSTGYKYRQQRASLSGSSVPRNCQCSKGTF